MKFYDTLDFGLCQSIDQICGSNAATFPFKTKAARLNSALDKYFSIGFEASGLHPLDDSNQTSPPIETQNLVSGTNRYKFSAFTSEVLSLIKLEILDSDGQGVELIPESINDLGDSFQELYLDTANVGTPSHYCKFGDFIYLRPFPNYSETAGLKAYFNRPASKFTFTRFTVTIAAPGVFSATAHGLVLNDIIMLETNGALPTGLSADTEYYVVETIAANTFSVSATQGGTAITTSGSQSGTHSFLKVSGKPGIPSIHHEYLARKASIPFLMEKKLPQLNGILKLVGSDNTRDPYYGGDELDIQRHFAHRNRDMKTQITFKQRPFR